MRGAAVNKTCKSKINQAGFTLVELLVALVIMVIMTGLSWRGLDVMLRSSELTQTRVDDIAALQNVIRQWDADLNAVQPVAVNGGPVVILNSANTLTPSFNQTLSAPFNATPSSAANSANAANAATSTLGSNASAISSVQNSNTSQVMSIDWDGRVLRLLRRSSTPAAGGLDAGLNVVGWTIRDNVWLRWQSPDLTRTSDLVNAWTQATLWAQNPSSEAKQYETPLMRTASWQIYYYRENAWSNALSSSGLNPSSQNASNQNSSSLTNPSNSSNALSPTNAPSSGVAGTYLPDAIRLEIQLPTALGGSLVKDWIRPAFSVNRS